MSNVVLVTGGARSGKSRYVLEMTAGYARKAFVATAEAFDDEMRERITKHQAERADSFLTVEEPVDLAGGAAFASGRHRSSRGGLPDGLARGNVMHHRKVDSIDAPEIRDLLEVLAEPPCNVFLVTNEVGMGIVPANAMARAYRDLAGALNQRVAAVASRLVFMVSGYPVDVKGGGK